MLLRMLPTLDDSDSLLDKANLREEREVSTQWNTNHRSDISQSMKYQPASDGAALSQKLTQ